jgi:hypothetical protein
MRHSYCYMPILRAKAGEFSAVQALSPLAKSRTTPLFDVPVPGSSDEQDARSYLLKRAQGIVDAWGTERPIYVDVHDLPQEGATDASLTRLFDVLKANGAQAIPVTGTVADRGVAYPNSLECVLESETSWGSYMSSCGYHSDAV